jgi:hypothetical protein
MTQETTPTASDPRLEEWLALANAATPGPWVSSSLGFQVLTGDRWNTICETHVRGKTKPEWEDGRAAASHSANAFFIAAAREAIPALIAMVRKVTAEASLHESMADLETQKRKEAEARATAAEADAAAARTQVRWLRNGLEEITGVGFDAPATFAGSDAEWERKRANIMQAIARRALGRAET